MKKNPFIISIIFCCFIFQSCKNEQTMSSDVNQSNLTLVTWNVQTFFDGEINGCEYDEFKKNQNWNRSKYEQRLRNLCFAINDLDADIYVLEEIENEKILYDISNQFAAKNWTPRQNWSYSCFSKPDSSAIGCAILSRYEILNLTSHGLSIKSAEFSQPEMRYLLKATLNVNDTRIAILANHWKSKSGGAEKTEIWRDWQESVLSQTVQELLTDDDKIPCIICGDFNRDITEFAKTKNTIFLRNAGFNKSGYIEVLSPWLTTSGNAAFDVGSYYFKNIWESIDHIFTSGNAKIIHFVPCTREPWCYPDKTPYSYNIISGGGYSDHVPLKATIQFN